MILVGFGFVILRKLIERKTQSTLSYPLRSHHLPDRRQRLMSCFLPGRNHNQILKKCSERGLVFKAPSPSSLFFIQLGLRPGLK